MSIQPPPGTIERTSNRPTLDTVLADVDTPVVASPATPDEPAVTMQSNGPTPRRARPWNRVVGGPRHTAERLAAFRKTNAARAVIKEDGAVVSADEPSFIVQNKKNPVAQAARKDLSSAGQDWKPSLRARVGKWMSSHRKLTFAMVAGVLVLGPAGLAIVLALANRKKIGNAMAASTTAVARGVGVGVDKMRNMAIDFMVKHGNPAMAAMSAKIINGVDAGRQSLKDLLSSRNPQPVPAVQAQGRKPRHG